MIERHVRTCIEQTIKYIFVVMSMLLICCKDMLVLNYNVYLSFSDLLNMYYIKVNRNNNEMLMNKVFSRLNT